MNLACGWCNSLVWNPECPEHGVNRPSQCISVDVEDAPETSRSVSPSSVPSAPTEREDAPAPAPRTAVVDLAPLEYLFRQWERGGYTLPLDSTERKAVPVDSGCVRYFPAALAAVAAWSFLNNQKHNPGQPLNWSQHKSADHDDCAARHTIDRGDTDDLFAQFVELTARAWRANAELQMFAQRIGAPVAPAARKGKGP